MNLTLAQVRTFASIVRLGSFHAAARELGLTQPSVSQRIRELEAALDTQLFNRSGPRLTLTSDGQALVGHAQRLLDGADTIVARFRTRDPLKGVLRLGLNESFALVCLCELLQVLEAEHPDLKTSMHVGDTQSVGELLNAGKLDVAVISQPDLEPHIRAVPIGTNRMGWFASPRLAPAETPVSPAMLAQHHLTISPPSARLYTTALTWFASAGVVPPQVSTCNTLSVTIQTILAGLTIGLVPTRMMQAEVERGEAILIPVAPVLPGHRVYLCYPADGLGPSLAQVLDLMRGICSTRRVFGLSA